jgi:hypothetical protein
VPPSRAKTDAPICRGRHAAPVGRDTKRLPGAGTVTGVLWYLTASPPARTRHAQQPPPARHSPRTHRLGRLLHTRCLPA